MARRYFIAGNWKMNNTAAQAVELINGINAQIAGETSVDVAVCPTFTALDASSKALAGSNVKLGAQNMYTKASGAYTGEISAEMLKELQALKEQLAAQQAANNSAPPPDTGSANNEEKTETTDNQ